MKQMKEKGKNPQVPKTALKQLIIREARKYRNKGKAVKKQQFSHKAESQDS